MAYPILGTPKPAFFDTAGVPLASGTITILNPDDDTVKASYPTAADADASTNGTSGDITLDSRGEPTSTQLWGRDGEDYKIVIKDSDAVTIYTMTDIRMGPHSRRASVTFTAADATPSVAESSTLILNDTTTITGFDDGKVGDVIFIKAAGSSTSNHTIQYNSATMQLAGSQNYQMRHDDTLTLAMFNDGAWNEIGRKQNMRGPQFLTADEVFSATTTLANVSDLSSWSFGPGQYVAVEGYLKVISSAVSQDLKIALQTDNAFQEEFWTWYNVNDAGTAESASIDPTTADVIDIVNSQTHGIIIRGNFLTHSSATQSFINFQAAQGTAAGTTTIEKGSWLSMYRIGQ